MMLRGILYEVTDVETFFRSFLADSSPINLGSISPIKGGWVGIQHAEGWTSGSSSSLGCPTDDAGQFELDVSQTPDGPMFLTASGSQNWLVDAWYRSPLSRPLSHDGNVLEIYVARVTMPDESGFSQADLDKVLEAMRQHVQDVERITGRITEDGIALSGSGSGATASCSILLKPDRSGNPETCICHTVQNFRLDLPGPAWLTGLLVNRSEIERKIRSGAKKLAGQIDEQLQKRAIAAFMGQAAGKGNAQADRIIRSATLTVERLRYPVTAGQQSPSGGHRSITGDVCLGFVQNRKRERT